MTETKPGPRVDLVTIDIADDGAITAGGEVRGKLTPQERAALEACLPDPVDAIEMLTGLKVALEPEP